MIFGISTIFLSNHFLSNYNNLENKKISCKNSRDGGEMELFQGTPFSPISKQYIILRQMDIKVYTTQMVQKHIFTFMIGTLVI